jgi:hypothetical protein
MQEDSYVSSLIHKRHLVAKYESASEAKDADENTRHHEQVEHTQNAFFDKVQKIYTVMKDMGSSTITFDNSICLLMSLVNGQS